MAHFHIPKPLHGWRQFLGEVGIIVLGVLIALSAEQLVGVLHSRWELRQFRSAMEDEVQSDLGAYEYRLKQSRCIGGRIAELEEWSKQLQMARGQHLSGPIGGPDHLALRTSVWKERTGSITNAMPLGQHLAYSTIYDWLAKFDEISASERDIWLDLDDFEDATKLDDLQQMRLHGLIRRARRVNDVISVNWLDLTNLARPLGLRPAPDANLRPLMNGLCSPILAPTRASKQAAR